MSKSIYLPGLNGLRAIAALAVVVSHITQGLGEFGLDPYLFGKTFEGTPKGLELAGYGVSVFFALSGFLITYLLLREKEEGRINIRNFYIRRILRIWPLYYFYLGLCIITILYQGDSINEGSLFYYLFFSANIAFIQNIPIPFMLHYWSLGVEEQFYAFWPWLARLEIKKLLRISIIILALLLLLKLVFRIIDIKYNISLPYTVIHVTRFHCMLMGAIGAILYYKKNNLFMAITTSPVTQAICWACIGIAAMNKFHLVAMIDNELISAITLCLIMGQVAGKFKIINLENNVMDFVGKISYGIYVYHPLILLYLSRVLGAIPGESLFKYLIVYLVIVFVTICVAWISYEYFEKKFLKIKLKYSTVRSINAKNI